MKCYIDDFNLVRIETYNYINDVYINDLKLSFIEVKGKNQYFKSSERIKLHLDNKIKVNNHLYNLNIGLVTLQKDFEENYRYDGFLGFKYSDLETEFRVFSPVATNITLVLNDKKYEMTYENPIWKVTIAENLLDAKYYYLVTLNHKTEKVIDPYAIAGNLDYSLVIDINQTSKTYHDFIRINKEDTVIYEGHVRDLSVYLDVKSKKNYLGLTEYSNLLGKSVIEYIKDLGMSHLQLLPLQDFIGVDEFNKDKYYNWGYNPAQYFTLSGYYSSNPSDYYLRINEVKKLVDYAHKNDLGVTLDVVYNHVYERNIFPYDKLVPGYFYRHNHNNKNTNFSLVGNDINTNNYMVRKLIVDSLIYLTKTFKFDGYRFDLMGLMDIETMRQIKVELSKINDNIILYGEGWNMDNVIDIDQRATMRNSSKFAYYSHFNDYFRDVIKGGQYSLNSGYITGNNNNLEDVLIALNGSSNIFEESIQSINYLDCHDNLTLYDFLTLRNISKDRIYYYLDFANHLLAISKGIIFYHAGQELYRSKKLSNNSYNLDDTYNGIKWDIPKSINKLKEILNLRKKYLTKYSNKSTYKVVDNLIINEVISGAKVLRIYIKNDFNESIIKDSGSNIFKSFEVIKNENNYILNYPGIYIFTDIK
ncbi:alpha-amylase family glycosyl hydrolase [Haploplasma modicum]|uniref:alpha-amylase family glycosyl hydrolase n=1 Tax=Haploplasma modicum TaxID=2150 RepID=UPI00214BE5EF|nr:alpha-amylase family glycosyl hydrolase [Haploplasma modicum]MCR1809106.1 alpha-amylase family glycosyl hydrolase [Haploplasma modicum]